MIRLAAIIIVVATVIGALMPSGTTTSPDSRSRGPIQVYEREEQDDSSQSRDAGSGTITIERAFDGHFYADAQVNGATVHFLIDTGASGIALSAADARRAGLAFSSSQEEVIGSGASGEVWGHYVRLNRVALGLKSVSDAEAVVLAGGERSLLGQSFLSKFGSVEIRGDTMVLR